VNFVSKALPMSRIGLATALDRLGLSAGESAGLWAVFEVETAGMTQGFGFRADKRPQILFERHVFSRLTKGRFNKSNPELSGPQGGYGSLASQYVKLEAAIGISEGAGLTAESALQSASWGIGQVMGFNHQAAGYASAKAMVEAMIEGEDAQLFGMTAFMVTNRLDEALRARDWTKFAKMYNGPAFATNHYDVKLQAQYARFASGSTPNLEVRSVQAGLLLLGYAPGKIDGVLGDRTRGALKGFQLAAGLPPTGELGPETYATVSKQAFGA